MTTKPGFLPHEPPPASARVRLLAVVAVAVTPALLYSRALVERTVLAPGDAFVYYLPVHILTGRAWRDGDLPAWNEFAFSGSQLLASGQPGAFYPPNLLFALLDPLTANDLVVLLNLSVAAVGAYVLARKLTGDAVAAAVAGVGFASSGFLYGHLGHQSIEAAVAWLPWVLYGYELLHERVTAARLLLTSGALGLALVAGHYQLFFLAVLVLAVYALGRELLGRPERRRIAALGAGALGALLVVEMAFTRSPTRDRVFLALAALVVFATAAALVRGSRGQFRVPRSPWIAAAVVVASLGLGAVQFLPTYRIVGDTLRADSTFEYATSYAYSPSHLPLLLFPYLFGNPAPAEPFDAGYTGEWNLTELAGYPGLACLVFAIAGLARIRRDPRALALVGVGLVALLVALGSSTSAGILVWHTPAYGDFRAWGRYVVALDLAVALLAAYGVAHLRAGGARERRSASRLAWAAAVALVVAGIVVPFLPPVSEFVSERRAGVLAVAIPLGAALAAAAATTLFARAGRLAVAACCTLVALDGALAFGAFYEWTRAPGRSAASRAFSTTAPPPWGALPSREGGLERYLYAGFTIQALGYFAGQVTAAKEIRSANGLDPLAPAPYVTFTGGMTDAGTVVRPRDFLERRSPLLDVLRISLVLAPREAAPLEPPPWLERRRAAGELVRYEYRPRVADAFLVGRVELASRSTILAWASGRTQFDPSHVALVDGQCDGCPTNAAPGDAGMARRENGPPGRIDVQVEATRPSLLVVSENAVPGWHATVDGRGAPVVRADGLALGVPVPAGSHIVSLRYRVPGLRLGAAISLATLVGLFAALAFERRRSRRVSSQA